MTQEINSIYLYEASPSNYRNIELKVPEGVEWVINENNRRNIWVLEPAIGKSYCLKSHNCQKWKEKKERKKKK